MDTQLISSKQLPPNHIIERRFKPYGKASQSIRHLENLHKLNQSPTYYDKCNDLHKRFKQQLPQNGLNKHSSIPISKISREIEEKIDLVGIYNNLSESKIVTKLSKRISQSPRIGYESPRKIEKNKYLNLINQALIECRKNSRKQREELAKTPEPLSTGRSFEKKKGMERESRCLERVESTNASEIARHSSKVNVKMMEKYFVTQLQEKISNLPAISQRKVRKANRGNSLEKALCITPILDAYNCIEFY